MILHASLPADDPRAVAQTFADLIEGEAFPLPGIADGGWLAIAGGSERAMIEVLPRGTEFAYLAGEHVAVRAGPPVRHGAFHVMIETPHDEARVFAIAADAGYSAHCTRHGYFEVIEFWIEGCTLVEVLTPPLAAAYRGLVTLDNARAVLGASRTAARSARAEALA